MPFVPFVNCVEAVINGTMAGKPIKNVLGFSGTSAPTLVNMKGLADALIDYLVTNVPTPFSSSYTVESVTINDLSSVSGLTLTETSSGSNSLPVHGAVSGQSNPAQVCVVSTYYTGIRGRSFRGRSYWSGIPASENTDESHVNLTYAGVVQGFAQGLINAVGASGYLPAVLSRVAGGVPRTVGVETLITSVVVNQRLDTQRRRLAP